MNTIKSRDFGTRTTDIQMTQWTNADLEHVIDALEGRDLIIEVDKQTGCSTTGRLVGQTTSGSCGGASATLHVRHEYAPGQFQQTNYLIFNVGVIVDLTTDLTADGGKWDALDRKRRAEREALDQAKAKAAEQGVDLTDAYGTVHGLGARQYDVTFRTQDQKSYESVFATRVRVEKVIGSKAALAERMAARV